MSKAGLTRYAAFMRALNVGGHVVKMDLLKSIFVKLGHKNVESFIASGNIVFESSSRSGAALEKKISEALKSALGYEVASFLRTAAELSEIAAYTPFKGIDDGPTYVVGFLAAPLDAATTKKLMALRSKADRIHVCGREFWWYSDNRQSEPTFTTAVMERTLGQRTTLRNLRTVRKMAAKWGS
ncbi:MAG: DUF1697 domain-containing protein [Gemmatimonadetes bacterium]|nr:DUF1697 domain-containing protein [Gemmatimonadota bacterium]